MLRLRKAAWMLIMTALLGLLASRPVGAQLRYSITDLGLFGGNFSQGTGINDREQVVGYYGAPNAQVHAFIWDPAHGMQDLGTPPGYPWSSATALNDRGDVIGNQPFPMIWHRNKILFLNNLIPAASGLTLSTVSGINNQGQIIGSAYLTGGNIFITHAVILTPKDTTPPIVTLSAAPSILWPPNGKMVQVVLAGKITDDEPINPNRVHYSVKDEYSQIQPHGPITIQSDGSYSVTILLEARRNGQSKDGRHYTIRVQAADVTGNAGSATTVVTVPHNR